MSGKKNKDWTLSAPGIHGECVPMRDLSREEVDFCVVGAGRAAESSARSSPKRGSLW